MTARYPIDFEDRTFTLGCDYIFCGRCVRFIRSTPKGFNFFDVENDKLLFLGKHFYDRKYNNRKIPGNVKEFTVTILRGLSYNIKEINK